MPTASVIPDLRYRGRANVNDTGIAANDLIESGTSEIKGSISYITGSHAFKFGVSNFWGKQTYNSPDSNTPYNYRFLNGVPEPDYRAAESVHGTQRRSPVGAGCVRAGQVDASNG